MEESVVDTQYMLSDNDLRHRIEEIRKARKKRLVVFMLTVFGDESHDGKKERIFAVSGVMATQEEWDMLERVWLDRTAGRPFHASECESDRGDYKGTPHEENQKLYKDLITILSKSNIQGYVAVMDLKAYNELFPNVPANMPYYFCFEKVVRWYFKIAYLSQDKQKVKFIFDRSFNLEASSVGLYNVLQESSDAKYVEDLLDEISFASHKSTVGIQVADLVAREAMKYCDDTFHSVKRRGIVRKSMQILDDTGNYYFAFYNRERFKGNKEQSDEWPEKTEFVEGLGQWLLKNKLEDVAYNRFQYLQYLQSTNTSPIPIFDFEEDDNEE